MQYYSSCRNRNVLCRDTKFVATSSFYTTTSGNCRDKHFSFQLVYSVTTDFCMSRQDFFGFFTISFVTEFSFIAIEFIFLSLLLAELFVMTWIFVATNLIWLISALFLFLSRSSFLLSRQNSINLQLLLSRQKTSFSRLRFCIQYFTMSER